MRVLARFCFPTPDLCDEADMYLRPHANTTYAADAGELRLNPHGEVRFDTYFNALAVGKLFDHTTVRHVTAAVEVTGVLHLDVLHQDVGSAARVIASADFATAEPTWCQVSLPALDELPTGAVFLRLRTAAAAAVVHRAEWLTSDAPARHVRLGIAITTFGHDQQVETNLARLFNAAVANDGFDQRLRVVVVDNRGAAGLKAPDGVTVLPNPNVGGAGGFTRGLMHLRSAGEVTHVLFMDDDVWFEPEVVFRTLEMLAFACDPLLCIAGAMLPDNRPTVQFEAGAQFRVKSIYPNRPVGTELELSDWRDVLAANVESETIDYGAWWFFAFPLSLTDDNPIPVFVRGDDVCWGLLYAGRHTIAMSGLAVWHVDFETKNSPASWFYDTRNYALVSVLASKTYRSWHLVVRYLNICGRSLLAMKYSSAELITFGLQEYLRGPAHWLTIDHAALNAEVRSRDQERVVPLEPGLADVPDVKVLTGLRKWLVALRSLFSLGGHVWPERWNRKPIVAVRVQQRALGAARGRNALLYRDTSGELGFVARRDRRRFFVLLWDMVKTSGRVVRQFHRTARAYREAYPEMTSDAYWLRQFGVEHPSSERIAERASS